MLGVLGQDSVGSSEAIMSYVRSSEAIMSCVRSSEAIMSYVGCLRARQC